MLTDRKIKGLKPGESATDPSPRGQSGLAVRRLASGGLSWYLTYSSQRRTHRIAIAASATLTLAEARERHADLCARIEALRPRYPDLARVNDLRGMLDADDAQRDAQAQAEGQATLAALLAAYVEDLKARGRIRVREVETCIARHILAPHPGLAAKPARAVTLDDCLLIVRRVVDGGHVREAAKVRSHLRAAYTAAIAARQRADGLPALAALGLSDNPAANIAALRGGQGKPGERALSLAELRAYWHRIQDVPQLLLHLLSGGQRVEQLARVTTTDLDRTSMMMVLRDPKGRRETARVHAVPLLAEALAAIDAMCPGDGFVFSVSAGRLGASYKAIDDLLKPIVAAMLAAGEASEAFTLGDLRRTVETRLAAAGVPESTRAQLQSHGLSGVQQRHYDRHSYLDEKRAALETLLHLCNSQPASVLTLRART
ncbi:hypothetical protein MyNCGM152_40970 [Achromobacter xylosoxidans]